MRVLSPILQRVVYPALGRVGYFHSRASAGVVTYHGVLPLGYRSSDAFLDNTLVSIDVFRSHLRLLKRHYNVISPERFLGWVRGLEDLPARAVLLTCDDGLLNDLTIMLPILQAEQLKCLFFVTGASTRNAPAMLWYVELYLMVMQARGKGEEVDWRGIRVPGIAANSVARRTQWLSLLHQLSNISSQGRAEFLTEAIHWWGLPQDWKHPYLDDALLRERFQLLCAPEVKQLTDAGMTVGAHTLSHPILSNQRADLAQTEISDCRQMLQHYCGQPVWAFAYPFGNAAAVGNREIDLARSAGYECAFMNVPGDLQTAPKFALPRVHITAEMSPDVYEAHVSGFHEQIRRRFVALHWRQSGIRA
jgi:peptidoglycan/xylan/chitin deacetylase (PgdA/CDA1 family)